MNTEDKQQKRIAGIVVIALGTVLTIGGSFIKFGPSAGSIALDSFPGYLVAGFYGPLLGALVGILGHIGSAATGGFPFHILHLAIALMQGIWCWIFGFIIRKINKTWAIGIAGLVAIILNGLVAPYLLTFIQPELTETFISLIPILLIASSINIVAAGIAIIFMSRLDIPRI